MVLTKKMEKDFKFMSLYSYTKRYNKMPFDNRIFWNNKIIFATNGNSFIWTETEENSEDFSVWEVQGKNFVELTFKIANSYNQIMTEEVALAKKHGKTKVVLYGESYVKFLLEYACSKNKIEFEKVSELKEPEIKDNEYAIAGEMNDKETKEKLLKAGCTDILELIQSNSSEDKIF